MEMTDSLLVALVVMGFLAIFLVAEIIVLRRSKKEAARREERIAGRISEALDGSTVDFANGFRSAVPLCNEFHPYLVGDGLDRYVEGQAEQQDK